MGEGLRSLLLLREGCTERWFALSSGKKEDLNGCRWELTRPATETTSLLVESDSDCCSPLAGILLSFVTETVGTSPEVFSEALPTCALPILPLSGDGEFDKGLEGEVVDELLVLVVVIAVVVATSLLVVVGGGVTDLDGGRNLVGLLLPTPLALDFLIISTMCSSAKTPACVCNYNNT